MTKKQRYQHTFGTLHASDDFLKEVSAMKTTKHFPARRLIGLCAAVILILAMSTAAYAADVGGIQRRVQLWIHGDQTDVVLDIRDGQYTATYEDSEGNSHEFGGGGVAIEPDGSERPLTEEELLEHLDHPEVEYEDDGTVWVYYRGQKIEITDKFDDSGVCYVQLKDGDDILYMTIKYRGGFAVNPNHYISPSQFNIGK